MAKKEKIQKIRERIDWIESIPSSGSGMSPMEAGGYQAELPGLYRELSRLEAKKSPR